MKIKIIRSVIAIMLAVVMTLGLSVSAPKTAHAEYLCCHDYLEELGGFIVSFEGLMDTFGELMELFEHLENEDEITEWVEAFNTLYEAVSETVNIMTDNISNAPEQYLEAHITLVLAMGYVYNVFTSFEYAVTAYADGDEDAFIGELLNYIIYIDEAAKIWENALAEFYLIFINDFVNVFTELMDYVGELLEGMEYVEDEDSLLDWAINYVIFQDLLEQIKDDMNLHQYIVPEKYKVSHMYFGFLLETVYKAIGNLFGALEEYLVGDEEAFLDGLIEFLEMLIDAGEYWEKAVEIIYADLMSKVIQNFETAMELIDDLILNYDEGWFELIGVITEYVRDIRTDITFLYDFVPYDLLDAHEIKVLALTMVIDALIEFEESMSAGEDNDCCLDELYNQMMVAAVLWLGAQE